MICHNSIERKAVVRMCSVLIDDAHHNQNTKRNNSHYWKLAAQFTERALLHCRLEGTVKIRPRNRATNHGPQMASITCRRPLRFLHQSGGSGSCWEYDVTCSSGLHFDSIKSAIEMEIDCLKPLPGPHNSQPLIPEDVKLSLENKTNHPAEATTETNQINQTNHPSQPTHDPNSSLNVVDAMQKVMTSALKVEQNRQEIATKRKTLAIYKDEAKQLAAKIKTIEDEIAALELENDNDIDAKRASAFLDAMANLMKSRNTI